MTTTIALITGANKGIGLETARQFGARGFTVLAGARDEGLGLAAERQLRADGADARFVSLDVTRDASVRRFKDIFAEIFETGPHTPAGSAASGSGAARGSRGRWPTGTASP